MNGSTFLDSESIIKHHQWNFPWYEKLIERIIKKLREIYRENALMTLAVSSKGHPLLSQAKVLTRQEIDKFLWINSQ